MVMMTLRRFTANGKMYFIFVTISVLVLYFIVLSHLLTTSATTRYSRAVPGKLSKKTVTIATKTTKLLLKENTNNKTFTCEHVNPDAWLSQRGKYYVIYNYVKAEKLFNCTESITLSAPGDYRFLDNIVPLVDRWRGPISVALYAPGEDFYTTLAAIAYLRNCETDLIKKYVTFHIIFDQHHTPPRRYQGFTLMESYVDYYKCTFPPPWKLFQDEDMYKYQNNLLYPINVARNVAKLASQTYFVFPSDIELYPTKRFISKFWEFVKSNMNMFLAGSKNVFVLPIFEVMENETIPETKNQLLKMLKHEKAILFHAGVCAHCHTVIDNDVWTKTKMTTDALNIFASGKRTGLYRLWEPFFVCTQKEPLWDERFTWEGQSNKMVQAYTMCVMDYNFHVLDNAFLIHKPGVKKKKVQMLKFKKEVNATNILMQKVAKELQDLYGYNDQCSTKHPKVIKLKDQLLISKAEVINNKQSSNVTKLKKLVL